MKARTFTLFLLLATLAAVPPAHAVIDTVDNVPAATLLVPYFEVPYTLTVTAPHTVVTIGNTANASTLVHVTLWTDRGVPTYAFDIRLPANGMQEIDLYSLFANGVLPQTTAGSFPGCGTALPPGNIPAATLKELQNAHIGYSSTLLGGECGGVRYDDAVARGYITVDVTSQCTSLFPGAPTYFVNGGTGIATNDNVIWGETHITDAQNGTAYGTPVVHIEASSTDTMTDGPDGFCDPHGTCPPNGLNPLPDYTFYRLRTGNADDNREALPQEWRAPFDMSNSSVRPFTRTYAQVWRDPGNATKFPCGAPPANLATTETLVFDDREEPSTALALEIPYPAQQIRIAPSAYLAAGFTRGFVHYNLTGGGLGDRRQAFVTHVFEGNGVRSAAVGWPISPIWRTNISLLAGGGFSPACSDGIDNDGDSLIDFPNDPGCRWANGFTESPACNDTFDNDGDTFADYPNDPQCHSASDFEESTNYECDDGVDNDGDGKIDWPADAGCSFFPDSTENTDACNDGIDNDGDGLIDYPADPGCSSKFSSLENPACNDGLDNDGDGKTDFPGDPGCSAASAGIENPQCSDGLDNDADTLTDFPNDPGCGSASSGNERPQCNDGLDNDGDTLTDLNDPGCLSAADPQEFETQCSDSLDNDGDGLIDYPNETGCSSAGDTNEGPDCSDGEDNDCDYVQDEFDAGCSNPNDLNEGSSTVRACSDGIDNDGDGVADFPNDPGCTSAYDDVEFDFAAAAAAASIPALSPFALVLLACLLALVAAIALRGGLSG